MSLDIMGENPKNRVGKHLILPKFINIMAVQARFETILRSIL